MSRAWWAVRWPFLWLLVLPMAAAPWVLDRSPPFSVTQYVAPEPVAAGGTVYFVLPARRDVERECDVRWSRYLIDAAGIRYDYQGGEMSADALRAQHLLMGPSVRIAQVVPPGAKPGPAILGTELTYTCNPLHLLWPIRVSLRWQFDVLERLP